MCWKPWADRNAVEVIRHDGPFVDCGTPADYLRANLAASGGRSVVGAGAVVDGVVERSVLWPGARVEEGEVLRDAVRTTGASPSWCADPSSGPLGRRGSLQRGAAAQPSVRTARGLDVGGP